MGEGRRGGGRWNNDGLGAERESEMKEKGKGYMVYCREGDQMKKGEGSWYGLRC